MQPWKQLARARAPGGRELSLHQRGDEICIRIRGEELMSSRRNHSERELAVLGCAGLDQADGVRILIGGLGLGFTVRAALERLSTDASVQVAEISDAVVAWNRQFVGHLADHPLDDPRVRVEVRDVATCIRQTRVRYHAILLDIDNGPQALTRQANHALYSTAGLTAISRALRPGGCLALWSAVRHKPFEHQLTRMGFAVTAHTTRARSGHKGAKHSIYIARVNAQRLRLPVTD